MVYLVGVMRILASLLLVVSLVFSANAQQRPQPKLMPQPANVQYGSGVLAIDQSFSVAFTGFDEPRIHRAAGRLLVTLERTSGMPMRMKVVDEKKATLVIHADKGGEKVQKLGEDESYRLTVSPTSARIDAPTPLGALRGLQTFAQLVQPTATNFAVPAVTIEDRPRFPWRGLMIDSSRHWMPVEVIKRNLDGMESVKLNVFHWHLSDNQGFRVESKVFPKLQQMGSDGEFYTQAEIKDVIEYARDRGIRVVPEFDMPGHSTAWFVGYPELASGPGPYEIDRHWGVFDPAMDPTSEKTYKFLAKFIAEMAALFPDEYFHIGGDEVNGKQWDANAKIQQFMRAHNLKDNHDLQAHFNKRVLEIVSKNHKTMIGWDEILRPDLQKSIVIQSWRGQKSLAEAARQGYRGILSSGYYLDLMQSTSAHYANDPLGGAAAGLSDEEKKSILGGEACMWSEMVTTENVDARIWPRMAAIAERFWSPQQVKDVADMYDRLAAADVRLERMGLTHRSSYDSMLERLSGGQEIQALETLAEVVEPVKEYARHGLYKKATGMKYSVETPLNRLVDVAHADSFTAVYFGQLVDRVIAKTATDSQREQMRQQLERWAKNDARLQPALRSSFLLSEVAPVSADLSAVAQIGLQALDALVSGKQQDNSVAQQQLETIKAASQPKAELLLGVTAPIEKLVRAASGQAATTTVVAN